MMSILPLLLLSPVLVYGAYSDLRYMRLPNSLSLIALALFAVSAITLPPPDLVARLVVAALVLAAGLTAFAFRLVGGGDVKLLSVLMLFVPTHALSVFGYVFSASMLLGLALVLGLRQFAFAAQSDWKSIGGSSGFPMGVSIGTAGIVFPLVVLALLGR